jgi:Tc toxin complex TcA C-terminal TcB-binding domain
VRLKESLFDLDSPSRYLRWIKTVALSVPCVTGPSASVDRKLTRQTSSTRTSPSAAGGYARDGLEDSRLSAGVFGWWPRFLSAATS